MRNTIVILILILLSCNNEDKKLMIGIQPFENIQEEEIKIVKHALEKEYKCKVYSLPRIKMPEKPFINLKSPRYRADIMLVELNKMKKDSLDFVIGLTSTDISFTKRDEFGMIKNPKSKYQDYGIFGLGQMPGSACIVSTFRLGNKLKKERLAKIAIHEIGHNLGLPHCSKKGCIMNDAAESIKTIDGLNYNLCGKCKHKISR